MSTEPPLYTISLETAKQIELWTFVISGIFSLSALCVSIFVIVQHLRHYSQPILQKNMIRILLMIPVPVHSPITPQRRARAPARFFVFPLCTNALSEQIYSLDSLFGLIFRDSSMYWTLARDWFVLCSSRFFLSL
jgi:hypothetical protein